MSKLETPTLQQIKEMQSKLMGIWMKTEEDLLPWEQACQSFFNANPSVEEKEKLLRSAVIFCGVAAGTIHASCFSDCQKQIVQHYESKIYSCQTLEEIKQIIDKINSVINSAVHTTPGKPKEAFETLNKAARKGFHLCKTRDELVKLIDCERVDIKYIIRTQLY